MNTEKPSRIAFSDRDVRLDDDKCAPSEYIECVSVPRFIKFNKEWIEKYAEVYKKVCDNYQDLLEGDEDKTSGGRWHGTENAEDQQKKKK